MSAQRDSAAEPPPQPPHFCAAGKVVPARPYTGLAKTKVKTHTGHQLNYNKSQPPGVGEPLNILMPGLHPHQWNQNLWGSDLGTRISKSSSL